MLYVFDILIWLDSISLLSQQTQSNINTVTWLLQNSVMGFFHPPNNFTNLVIIRIEITNDKPCYIVYSNSPRVIDQSNLSSRQFAAQWITTHNITLLVIFYFWNKVSSDKLSVIGRGTNLSPMVGLIIQCDYQH